jgi:hypothetical protein
MLDQADRIARDQARRTLRKITQKARREVLAQRPPNPKADRGRVRDSGFLAFLRRQPCCVGPLGCCGPVEAAHIRFARPGQPMTGMQRKPDDKDATPLCAGHHRTNPDAQHAGNERAFWARHGIDPHELADRLYAEYLGAQSVEGGTAHG